MSTGVETPLVHGLKVVYHVHVLDSPDKNDYKLDAPRAESRGSETALRDRDPIVPFVPLCLTHIPHAHHPLQRQQRASGSYKAQEMQAGKAPPSM